MPSESSPNSPEPEPHVGVDLTVRLTCYTTTTTTTGKKITKRVTKDNKTKELRHIFQSTKENYVLLLKKILLKHGVTTTLTNPYPGPRSVLVLDNCNIHHAEEVRALVEDEGLCKLMFLPPYSPDLNPIEQAFFSIKAYLRRHCDDFSLSVMDRACQHVNSAMAWGFFRASGYVV